MVACVNVVVFASRVPALVPSLFALGSWFGGGARAEVGSVAEVLAICVCGLASDAG